MQAEFAEMRSDLDMTTYAPLRIWHISDSRGQILFLIFRFKNEPFQPIPSSLGSGSLKQETPTSDPNPQDSEFTDHASRTTFASLPQTRNLKYFSPSHTTWWSSKRLSSHNFGGYVTKCALHKALKSIARCESAFDERIVAHRATQ